MIDALIEIYPDSLLNPSKETLEKVDHYYHISDEKDQLYIASDDLNKEEIQLLNLLKNKNQLTINESRILEDLLLKGKIDNLLGMENAQIVFLNVNHLEDERYPLWKSTLLDSIHQIKELGYMSEDLIILLLDGDSTNKELVKRLKEVIQSLDQDFNLLTQGMIGQRIQLTPQITEVFQYESNLFQSFIKEERVEGILSISDMLMNQQGLLLKKEGPVLPTLYNVLANNSELRELIKSLFNNQGNLSKTAEELFIHRNTLSYRMNKFNDKTAFDLNYFPDLILCYLLII